MSRFLRALLILVLLVASSGCLSAQIRDSWVSPDYVGPLDFERTIVVFMDPEERNRRAAEDAVVRRIGTDRAVASHTMFSAEEVRNAQNNQEEVRREVQEAGIDGAVVMRMVDEEQRLSYTPGMTYPTYYGGFYGYYRWGWGYAYSPGYVTSNTVVTVETAVYDLDTDELVWSGVTETFNPGDIRNMVNDIAEAVIHDLRNRRLLDAP